MLRDIEISKENLTEIEHWLTRNSGYDKYNLINKIKKYFELSEGDSVAIYRYWRSRYIKPEYNMSAAQEDGIFKKSADEKIELLASRSRKYTKKDFNGVLNMVEEGFTIREISKRLGLEVREIDTILTRLRHYSVTEVYFRIQSGI